MISTLMAMMSDAGNYRERKVDRTTVKGLIVSTAYSSDCGYETAIIDTVKVHPVERYSNKNEAIIGHKKWVKKAENLEKVIRLGDADGWLKEEEVILKRKVEP